MGAPEAAVREAVEWGAGVKGGKSRTRRLLSSCGRLTLVVAVRRRLQRRHSRQPEKSRQGGQLLGAPEAAVREAVDWGKVVKVAVRRRSLHLLR